MDDTDQLLRVTTPFIRPGLESLEPVGQLDMTPTTAPGNTPGTPRRRLARGTISPPVEVLKLEAPALPVRLIDPPTRWSYRQRVDLSETFYSLPPVAGEIDTAPVRRIASGTPWRVVIALSAALVVVVAAIAVVMSGNRQPATGNRQPATEVPTAAPSTVVVALPSEPAAVPAPETIVLPADPADDLAAIDALAAAADAADVADEPAEPADEIEMPAQDVAPAAAAPAPVATHATLMIGSKPPCRIFIDGRDTGLTTPNRAVRVPAGRHTITLVNEELGIRHAETLNITGGRKAKMIRDLTKHIDG